jgi:thiamine-phosphate pyrophosphorylase
VSAGPVAPTPTKPGRPGTGAAYVAFAVANTARPVFVTGGVTPETIPSLAGVGARHFVVVRYLTEAADPRRSASQLRASIEEHVAEAAP